MAVEGEGTEAQQDDPSSTNDIVGFDFADEGEDFDADSSDDLGVDGEPEDAADEDELEASPGSGEEAEGALDEELTPEEAEIAEEILAEMQEAGELPAEEAETAEPEAPSTVRLGDRDYTAEEADQAFRSALGQQSRAQELERQNAELIAALTKSKTQEEGETKSPKQEKKGPPRLEEVVDPAVYEKLLETPDLGPKEALRYVVDQFQEVLDANNKANIEATKELLAPHEVTREENEQFNEMVALFTSVGEKVDKDGNRLYPELTEDAGFVEAVGNRILNVPGLKEAGEMGVYLAYLAEREWRRLSAPPETEEQPQEEQEEIAASEALEPNAEELERNIEEVDVGGDTRLPTRAVTDDDKLRSKLHRELIEHAESVDPVIGFDF